VEVELCRQILLLKFFVPVEGTDHDGGERHELAEDDEYPGENVKVQLEHLVPLEAVEVVLGFFIFYDPVVFGDILAHQGGDDRQEEGE